VQKDIGFGGVSGGMSSVLVALPQDAKDPAVFSTRFAGLQSALGVNILAPGPPIAWLAPAAHLRRKRGSAAALPHAPLWWAGDEWREFPDVSGASHVQTHPAYAPRRFEPPRHLGGLVRPVDAPLEVGPLGEDGHAAGVVRVLRALLCVQDGVLWARPWDGSEWRQCPHRFTFHLARTEAFEVCSGDWYVFLFRDRSNGVGGLEIVLLYSVLQNEWGPLVGPARTTAQGHAGEPPVRWRPVELGKVACVTPPALLRAWLLESTPDYLMLLSPVGRDGVQRSNNDVHSAIHFIGRSCEVVTHHMACSPSRLTMQRYDKYMLFVKDFDEHLEDQPDACLDDNWHPSYPRIAGWLVAAEDIAVPPLPIQLPDAREGFKACASSSGGSWSLALARGNIEELAPTYQLRMDTAPRVLLLEMGDVLRIWASRRVDDAFGVVYERHTLDGTKLIRHALGFQPIERSLLEVGAAGVAAPGAWALWVPDIQHVARVGPTEKIAFWRCAVMFEGEVSGLQALNPCAYEAPAEAVVEVSPLEVSPLCASWGACGRGSDDARGGAVVTGLPIFPELRWSEATFNRPEDHWLHPVGRDVAGHAPLGQLH